jgi:hypothetical protein
MKAKNTRYTIPTTDQLARLRPLTRAQELALGLPAPGEATLLPVVVLHGGARAGAGRKPTGNYALQLRVPLALARRVRAEAKKRGLTLSAYAAEKLGA